MDYITLLDLTTDLGYELAMAGAETFRIEESVSRIMASYEVNAEVFAIPNYLIVSIITDDGTPITRMRRIGAHGNDLDSVEKFSNLSRALCSRKTGSGDRCPVVGDHPLQASALQPFVPLFGLFSGCRRLYPVLWRQSG